MFITITNIATISVINIFFVLNITTIIIIIMIITIIIIIITKAGGPSPPQSEHGDGGDDEEKSVLQVKTMTSESCARRALLAGQADQPCDQHWLRRNGDLLRHRSHPLHQILHR